MLYRKPAKAPQLSNHGIWHAKPILISGATDGPLQVRLAGCHRSASFG
jgi:hypothetical protein